MPFPNAKELARMREALESVEGSYYLPENASPRERIRFEICQSFVKYLREHGLKQKELAETLEIDKGDMSKILNYKIAEISTDRLLDLYAKINPDLHLNFG